MDAAYQALIAMLKEMRGLLVAFSGGVDSSLLLAAARDSCCTLLPFRRDCFRQLVFNIVFIKQHLSLQVVILNKIPVNNLDLADPGTHENSRDYCSKCTAANDRLLTFAKLSLPLLANGGKEDLPRISVNHYRVLFLVPEQAISFF